MGVDATGMKTRMRLRWPSGGGVCPVEHNGKTCQQLWTGEVWPLDGSLLMGDFSVALFQPHFMLFSEKNRMKVHTNQWLLTMPQPPGSSALLVNQSWPLSFGAKREGC